MTLCKWCKRFGGHPHTRCKGNLVAPEILGETPTTCQCSCNKAPRKEINDYRFPNLKGLV